MVETSVIIPFKNAGATLKSCLAGLMNQKYRAFEVILVNNNSVDSSLSIVEDFTRDYARSFKIQIANETKPGASAARNRGVDLARGEYLAFTDADCVADPCWLAEITEAFDSAQVGAVAGNIKGYQPSGMIDAFHGLFTLKGLPETKTFNSFELTSGGFPTANLVIRTEVFTKVGGFDETIPIYGEDYDLCARVYKHGFRIKYIPNGIIRHIHRSTIMSTWKQGFGFGKSHALLLRKHFNNYLLIEVSRWYIRSTKIPWRAWLNITSADKKFTLILIMTIFYWPIFPLIPIYWAFLTNGIAGRAKRAQLQLNKIEYVSMAGILILKSAALTLGRLWGAIKYKVLCF